MHIIRGTNNYGQCWENNVAQYLYMSFLYIHPWKYVTSPIICQFHHWIHLNEVYISDLVQSCNASASSERRSWSCTELPFGMSSDNKGWQASQNMPCSSRLDQSVAEEALLRHPNVVKWSPPQWDTPRGHPWQTGGKQTPSFRFLSA